MYVLWNAIIAISYSVADRLCCAIQVCELDIIYNFHRAYYLLDEVMLAGELQEANKREILHTITFQDRLVDELTGKADENIVI